jgi:hypothetical protein
MKKKVICFFAMCCFITTYISAQNKFYGDFHLGMPISTEINWEGLNISLDLGIFKKLSAKTSIGVGSSYYSLDLKPSNSTISFDREVLELFIAGRYFQEISKKVGIAPGIRLGYAFVNYSPNEFSSDSKKTNGFSFTPEIIVNYNLTEKLIFNTGIDFNLIFSDMNVSDGIIIPQSYIVNDNNIIFNPSLKIGVSYIF